MAIREFELFHGCVMAKILRSDRPISLRLIETKPQEHWSTYTLNDSVELFITYSTAPRAIRQKGGGTSWTFVFSPKQLQQINPATRKNKVFLALVCGRRDLNNLSQEKWQICLLEPQEINQIISFEANQQSVTVRCPSSKGKLRVYKDKKQEFLVPQSRIDKWEIPNS